MMKFLMMMMFLIPISLMNLYWLISYMFLLMSFMCLLNMKYSFLMMNLSYCFFSDLLSYTMLLLSFWICFLMILASSKINKLKNYVKVFNFMILMLMISLFMTFSMNNLFLFYVFFEMSLIPVLILIIGWGYQPERIQAGSYLLFYTLLASLPMMIFMFLFFKKSYSLSFLIINDYKINSILMFFFMSMVFLVKMPMYFVHLWLPKAHVEAPVSGSMILAGVMLKLGGYGMLRLLNNFVIINVTFNYLIVTVSLLGGVIVSLICLRQSDMKSLIAYSSVSHMGLMLGGLITMNFWGLYGVLGIMIAHGLCSSGLFSLANINYERMSSRSLYLNKGMMNSMPSLALWWFLLCSSNMAAPPSFNLLSEIMLINSLVSWSVNCMILVGLISFFSAAYSLYLFSYSQHGQIYSGMYFYMNSKFQEFQLLALHWIPLNLMILKSEFFFMWV
uniref:NADH-ubiquinone oxidoreductase chain 4 n=1 Tax=Coleoptera sp. ACP-2013 TaxID=2485033 RepID=A0A3G3ME53_9COLE|nr:NADH dehydrogenase subunit 4 [Coleoptera sp. ACP-2013]